MFFIGLLCGILISALIFAILAFFRAGIEKNIKIIQTSLEKAGPKPKGFIIEPPSQADEARERIIKKNEKQGKDTPLTELYD